MTSSKPVFTELDREILLSAVAKLATAVTLLASATRGLPPSTSVDIVEKMEAVAASLNSLYPRG